MTQGGRTTIAVAVLVRAGRVLLAHRHPARRWYPDCWDFVGGHVEAGESASDTVRRECLEELGIVVGEAEPLALEIDDPSLDLHAFVLRTWQGEPSNCAAEEHDDLRWFRPEEIPDLVLAHHGIIRTAEQAVR